MMKRRLATLAFLLFLLPSPLYAEGGAPVANAPSGVQPVDSEGETVKEPSGRGPSEQVISQITQEVSNEVLSPFCPGKTLAMCPSPAAAEARRTIQALAAKGLTKEEITDELIDQYGAEFKRVTPGLDDNLVVLVLVVIGLILCSTFVWFLSFRGVRKDKDSEVLQPIDKPKNSEGDDVITETSLSSDEEENDDYLSAIREEYQG